VRLSDSEAEIVRQLVGRTGLAAGVLIRRALLDAPPPPGVRRASAEVEAAVRMLAALGKIGSNINQLASHAEMGCFDDRTAEVIRYAVRDMMELRFVCLQALGHDRGRGLDSEPDESHLDD